MKQRVWLLFECCVCDIIFMISKEDNNRREREFNCSTERQNASPNKRVYVVCVGGLKSWYYWAEMDLKAFRHTISPLLGPKKRRSKSLFRTTGPEQWGTIRHYHRDSIISPRPHLRTSTKVWILSREIYVNYLVTWSLDHIKKSQRKI